MTKTTRLAALIVISLVLAAGFAIAWQYWPPLLKYRQQRLADAYNSQVRRYLAGVDSLEAAAPRLGRTILEMTVVMDRLQFPETAPGEGSLVAMTVIDPPPDIPKDDPRVEELVLNALKFAHPSGAPEAFTNHTARMWDSVIQSKGYRSVR